MYCANCGKLIEENAVFCPECGTRNIQGQEQVRNSDYIQQTVSKGKLNIMAIIGFVIACVSILINFAGIVGIVALVFSVAGLVQINGGNGKGKGFAIAGMVVGAFSVLYGFIMILLFGI